MLAPSAAAPAPAPAAAGLLAGKRVSVVHLGCPKNLVDSEHMLAGLQAEGAELTGLAEQADVLVLNTCAFIDAAKQESIDRILEGERWKAGREGRRLVVAGCLAERYPHELKVEVPAIDSVVGTGGVLAVARAAAGLAGGAPTGKLPEWLPTAATARVLTTPTHTAYLKISEGCDHTCSFCIIPRLRGLHRSRPLDDLLAEARSLAAMGVVELNLVAQDSTAYGEDIGLKDGIARLVRALGSVEGIEWVRVHYAYPTRVTNAFLDALGETPNAAAYIDIPLQHASGAVLRSMRRGGDGASYLRMLERMRARVPGLTVRSTFIVGYPNETPRRFEELLDFVRAARLDRAGAFTYSDEEGTRAAGLRDRVPAREKERRRKELMGVQARVSARRMKALVGQTRRVLVDGVDPDRRVAQARLEGQAPEIDGSVLVAGADCEPGEFLDVRITRARTHDLEGVPAC